MSIEKAILTLKKRNIRLTPQRLELLIIFSKENKHWTVEKLYNLIYETMPTVSVTTIYKNIKLFCEIGLIKEIQFGESLSKYEWKQEDHYHVVCSKCEEIVELYYPSLKEVEIFAESISKYNISSYKLQFYGICNKCDQN